jgi:hypothetical protein
MMPGESTSSFARIRHGLGSITLAQTTLSGSFPILQAAIRFIAMLDFDG